MKQNFSFIYKLLLLGGDTASLLSGFTLAYILRVTLDPRPVALPVKATTYLTLIIILLPMWLAIFSVLGLYTKRIYERRPKEAARLLVGAVSGVLLFVSFDFFSEEVIFPAKLVPIYAVLISFGLMWIIRTLLRFLRLYLYKKNYAVMRVLLVGNSDSTYWISKYLYDNPTSGFRVVGVLSQKKHIYEGLQHLQQKTLSTAITKTDAHAIIQTDSEDVASVYNQAIKNHLDYQFVPSHSALFTSRHSVELLGAFPIINVHTTPLIGYGRVVKRIMDVFLGTLGLVLSLPFTIVIAAIIKLSDPKSHVFYKQERLSRFNKSILIYKFRTHKAQFNGMSPEEVFIAMNRQDLLDQYRSGGDQLEDDPRITTFGKVLRKLSLDELPQLFNVIRGDISLVGPRALVPFELQNYEHKSLILSVKSGLTGLAQISGRRDISFEERRKLDMYYVQNWSIWLDLQIIIRTVISVLRGVGAK